MDVYVVSFEGEPQKVFTNEYLAREWVARVSVDGSVQSMFEVQRAELCVGVYKDGNVALAKGVVA